MNLSVVVFEVNLVGSNPRERWIDIGVALHVYLDQNMFTSFEPVDSGEKLFMGNSATSEIQGKER